MLFIRTDVISVRRWKKRPSSRGAVANAIVRYQKLASSHLHDATLFGTFLTTWGLQGGVACGSSVGSTMSSSRSLKRRPKPSDWLRPPPRNDSPHASDDAQLIIYTKST
ncbi:hypothetical protein [Aporhodopirellula aestuarii]|uniref:Uncharacterized protein n=1 Tax=Aporhodopirellula aestuarii TaxID=2950107 RepID=A0ABT0U639_9BACT|nr:hypothetical protein [Aporhodopirellula aestuarii]MCM2371858.1 hypothetical protein [Aporhodopirellula aestuarii]